MHRCIARRRRAGFTLVELMVTVLIGVIVVAGIYLMYSRSTEGYRIQNQSLDAMGQLRLASRQIRADLRRVGYNAPAQSTNEPWVTTGTTIPAPALPLTGLAVSVDPNFPVANDGQNQNIAPQQIRMLGDFWGGRYVVEGITGTVVTLRWEDGRAEFDRIFGADAAHDHRMLRIETYGTGRQEQIIRIADRQWIDGGTLGPRPTITLASQPQVDGFGTGSEATILGYVRYRLVQDNRRANDSVKYDLVREELNPGGQPVQGTGLIVAEHVVDLQVYDICINTTVPDAEMRQEPVNIQCANNLANVPVALPGRSLQPGNNNNASDLLRSLTVKIAARTPFEDESVPFQARDGLNEPLRTFELDPDMEGAARVFELATTVTLTGLQARRM